MNVGDILTLQEIGEYMGVSYSQMKKADTQQRHLENFAKYYEYELILTKRGGKVFKITKILDKNYQRLGRNHARMDEKNRIYRKHIILYTQKYSFYTYTALALYLNTIDEIVAMHHSSTIYTKTRENTKILFGDGKIKTDGEVGRLGSKEWMKETGNEEKYKVYEPMTEDEIKEFINMCNESGLWDKEIDIAETILNNETKSSSVIFMEKYLDLKRDFREKHHYMPMKIYERILDNFKRDRWNTYINP